MYAAMYWGLSMKKKIMTIGYYLQNEIYSVIFFSIIDRRYIFD